jgi:hypothetical protein
MAERKRALKNIQQYNKATIALLAPALVAIGARYGLALSADEAAILAALVTGIIVYLIPNKQLHTEQPKEEEKKDDQH